MKRDRIGLTFFAPIPDPSPPPPDAKEKLEKEKLGWTRARLVAEIQMEKLDNLLKAAEVRKRLGTWKSGAGGYWDSVALGAAENQIEEYQREQEWRRRK
jgi:hypothetical protein